MNAVLIGRAETESPEWHALRAGGIGASEVAGVVGLSRWSSPFQMWHRKKGNLPPQAATGRMEWGNRLEPVIAAKFIEEHPELNVTLTPGTYAHAERGWQRCNPDGLLPDALLEVKNASAYAADWTKEDIPLEYHCQVQYAMDILDLPRAFVAVLIDGGSYREYVIEADSEDQAKLRAGAEAFWNSLSAGDEPPLDCSDHTYQAVRELNPSIDRDLMVDLPTEMWSRYVEAKLGVDHHNEALQLAKSELLHFMGLARTGRHAGEAVIRRQMSSGGTAYLKEVS